MKRIVFYSWQSDLDGAGNRSLIQDAIERALKAIKRDDTATLEPALDRDTAGLPGAPSIAHSIFDKISLADVFVADVSIINSGERNRPTPNPNVLTELGYAVGVLGWDRIILVQNTHYGNPDSLPFDLRGRRVVTYSYEGPSDKDKKSEIRALLQGRLEQAFRSSLHDSTGTSLPTGEYAPLWWGKWKEPDMELGYGGTLFIREVGAAGFLFDLSVYNGAHVGAITAFARIISPNLAYARISNGSGKPFGEIVFRRSIDGSTRKVLVEETESCSGHHGMGAPFSGTFIHRDEYFFDRSFFNEVDLQRLYNLTGQFYDHLRASMQGTSDDDNLDSFNASVLTGGVRGLYTINEGIVMKGPNGELWAAYIDGDNVRYFTTQHDWKLKLPVTIEKWRERFGDKQVIFNSPVEIVPKNSWA